MANQNEPAKLLLPYLQRADELQKHEPLVSYYCRLYAMERGLKIPQGERTKTTNALLMSLIKQLEKDKKSLNLSPDDNLHLEGFALNVFGKADKQDRAGRADLNTAKTFYAASIFFEVLSQFGPIPPDFEQKQKYAVWKAADIRKAIKEGRRPNPGPPGGEDEFSVPSSTPSGSYDLGPSEHTATGSRRETDPSLNVNDEVSPQDFHDLPQPPQSGFQEYVNHEHYTDISPSHPPHPTTTYHSNELPPDNRSDNAAYSQFHNHQPYHSDPQEPSPQNYPSHGYQPDPQQPAPQNHPSHGYQPDPRQPSPQNHPSHDYHPDRQQPSPQNYPSHESSHPYPNFQSYPSFTESSLPSVPTHFPSQYQNPDTYVTHQSAPSSTSYSSAPQYSSGGRNSSIADPIPSPAQKFQYDSSYQPPPDKIAEAHKAARFAVGALAFDDVSVAVAHLTKSLELLTNPNPSPSQ